MGVNPEALLVYMDRDNSLPDIHVTEGNHKHKSHSLAKRTSKAWEV